MLHTLRRAVHPLVVLGIGLLPTISCSPRGAEDPPKTAWDVHQQAGLDALEMGRYTEADSSLQLALAEAKTFQEQDPRLRSTLDRLAYVSVIQGHIARAESLYKQLLVIQEEHLGPAAERSAATLGQLADIYRTQGEFARAESLYAHLLTVQEEHLELHDLGITATLEKMADLLRAQGDFVRSDSLHKRALGIKSHGQGHAYFLEDRIGKAEEYYLRALAVQEQSLDPSHPDLHRTCTDLAWLYEMREAYERAETFYRRSLSIQEDIFGADHLQLTRTIDDLAGLLRKDGRHEEAVALEARAHDIRAQTSTLQESSSGR